MKTILLAVVAMIGVAGCTGPGPNLTLQRAEAAYEQAQQNANARAYAPQTLETARRYLDLAQAGWRKGFNRSNVYFYSDLSRRYAEAAVAQGAAAAAGRRDVAATRALAEPAHW